MRILVTGAHGLLGSEFLRVGAVDGHDVVGAGRDELDVTLPTEVERFVSGGGFDWVVHCAAYTAVDAAEGEAELARSVNVEGTRHLARAARTAGSGMVYISTDYVFDGRSGTPYLPTDEPNPLSVYGRTKRDGELVVLGAFGDPSHSDSSAPPPPLIVRTGWLYGERGQGFVRSMLDRAARGEMLRIVKDQCGRPTFAPHVAATVLQLMSGVQNRAEGAARLEAEIWHVADAGVGTWLELAEEAFRLAGVHSEVEAVSSEQFGAAATRPAYSVLDLVKTERALGRAMPQWREVLAEVLASSN